MEKIKPRVLQRTKGQPHPVCIDQSRKNFNLTILRIVKIIIKITSFCCLIKQKERLDIIQSYCNREKRPQYKTEVNSEHNTDNSEIVVKEWSEGQFLENH